MELGVKGEPWTGSEIELAVKLYMDLYERSANGETFSKLAEFIELSRKLRVRTKASVELKLCNISSVLVGLGWPHLPGLGPMPHIQRAIIPYVASALNDRQSVDAAARRMLRDRPIAGPIDLVLAATVPRILNSSNLFASGGLAGVRRNYLELESRNSALGLAGELAVVSFEEKRLTALGGVKLARRIEHVSSTRGDGLGYDVHSFELDGRDKLIEVKTTSGSGSVPFFVSRNELAVSRELASVYCLSRVFDYPSETLTRKKVQVYELRGSLHDSCILDADSFKAIPRASS